MISCFFLLFAPLKPVLQLTRRRAEQATRKLIIYSSTPSVSMMNFVVPFISEEIPAKD